MGELTRRGFVRSSAGAAVGMAAAGAFSVEPAAADAPPDSRAVLAYVRDPRSGEISVMTGDHEVTVRDPRLAAQIARAAR